MKQIFFILPLMIALCSCQPKTTAQKLQQATEKENKKYPQIVAANIQIDSVKYSIEQNKLTYYYSLSEELDNIELIAANHSLLQLQLEEAVENEPSLLPYRDFGATISYCYYSKSTSKMLTEFTVEGAK
ncbi:MAG: hypothetical protein ACRC8J_01705 [Phocaeicola sp.]